MKGFVELVLAFLRIQCVLLCSGFIQVVFAANLLAAEDGRRSSSSSSPSLASLDRDPEYSVRKRCVSDPSGARSGKTCLSRSDVQGSDCEEGVCTDPDSILDGGKEESRPRHLRGLDHSACDDSGFLASSSGATTALGRSSECESRARRSSKSTDEGDVIDNIVEEQDHPRVVGEVVGLHARARREQDLDDYDFPGLRNVGASSSTT
ncbi:unnamed protein product, partial [Amoebophrya sp. A25]|eukprot:GSA25T00023927001.1